MVDENAPVVINHVTGATAGGIIQAGTINHLSIEPFSGATLHPRQLPAPPAGFVGRGEVLAKISEVAIEQADANAGRIVIVTGMAGVGKTATVLHWAHAHRKIFDGELYFDLTDPIHTERGAISDLIAECLRSLGVQDSKIPRSFTERAALYRSRTSTSRFIIVLDNVHLFSQIEPFMPGSLDSVVLATSRNRLPGAVVLGASLVEVKPVIDEDGSEILRKAVSDDRLTDDSMLNRLVKLCAGLPIALRVSAAILVQNRHWTLSHLVDRLTGGRARLDYFKVDGDPIVKEVFDTAYASLPLGLAQLYRSLALHPGPEFSKEVAAAAVNISPSNAEDILRSLCTVNLLEEHKPDRFRFHDIVRMHATWCAHTKESVVTRTQIERRIVDWYRSGAAAADLAILGPARWRLVQPGTTSPDRTLTASSAMRWAEEERSNLTTAVKLAHQRGWHDAVWHFCEALWGFYHSRKLYFDWISTHRLGVDAAVQTENLAAESRIRNQLVRAYIELGLFPAAEDELNEARRVAEESHSIRARVMYHKSHALLLREKGMTALSVEQLKQAKEMHQEMSNIRGVAIQAYHLGDAFISMEQPLNAVSELVESIEIMTEHKDELGIARAQIYLGKAHDMLGNTRDALGALASAANKMHEMRQPLKEISALEIMYRIARRDSIAELSKRCGTRLFILLDEADDDRKEEFRRWYDAKEQTT